MLRLVLALLLAAILGLPHGRPALAHAVLLDTVPRDGAAMADAPDAVVLRFNEPVAPIAVRVLNASGEAVTTAADVAALDREVRVRLPTGLPPGAYVAAYRVTSADGHPVSGSLIFAIGAEPSSGSEAAVPDVARREDGWRLALVLNRTIHFAALFAALGGPIFVFVVAGGSAILLSATRRVLLSLVGLAGLTGLLGLGLQGGLLAAAPASALAAGDTWRLGAATSLGPSTLLVLTGLLVAGLSLWSLRARRILAVAGALLAAAGLSLTGHAATAEPRWLVVPAVAVHTLAAAFWIGALWPLRALLSVADPREAAPMIQRFSRIAVVAVAALAAAGIALASVQLDGVPSLIRTTYGETLVSKLAFVATLLAVAAGNKWRLTPGVVRGESGAVEALRRSIRFELALVGIILLFTATLGQTPPPRAVAEGALTAHHGHDRDAAPVSPVSVAANAHGHTAFLELAPARAGRNTLRLRLTRPDGQPLEAKEALAEFVLPEREVPPIRRSMAEAGPGLFAHAGPELSLPGQWEVRIEVLISDFDRLVFQAVVPVAP